MIFEKYGKSAAAGRVILLNEESNVWQECQDICRYAELNVLAVTMRSPEQV